MVDLFGGDELRFFWNCGVVGACELQCAVGFLDQDFFVQVLEGCRGVIERWGYPDRLGLS